MGFSCEHVAQRGRKFCYKTVSDFLFQIPFCHPCRIACIFLVQGIYIRGSKMQEETKQRKRAEVQTNRTEGKFLKVAFFLHHWPKLSHMLHLAAQADQKFCEPGAQPNLYYHGHQEITNSLYHKGKEIGLKGGDMSRY